MMTPVIWAQLGRFRDYALSAFLVFGATGIFGWVILQIATTSGPAFNTAAKVFFAGFALLMALVVMGTVASTIATQSIVLSTALSIRAEIAELALAMTLLRKDLEAKDKEQHPS